MEPKDHMSNMEKAEGDRDVIDRELKRQDEWEAANARKKQDPSRKAPDAARDGMAPKA